MLTSRAITLMRLPLALMVVFIHLNFRADTAAIHWLSPTQSDIMPICVSVWVKEMAALAVPLFFAVSGYLFFLNAKWSKQTYTAKLKRRARSLLAPYLVFNTLAALFLILNSVIDGHSLARAAQTYLGHLRWLTNYWCVHTAGHNTNLLGWTKAVSYPADIPLWFVRDLIITVLFAPLWHWLLRRLGAGWLIILLLLSLTGIWIPVAGFSAGSSFYFCLGAWCVKHNGTVVRFLIRRRAPLTLLYIILLTADFALWGTGLKTYIHFFTILTGTATLSAWFLRLAMCTPSRWFPLLERHAAPLSFFVFAVHALPIIHIPAPGIRGMRPVEWMKTLLWSSKDAPWLQVGEMLLSGIGAMAICVMIYIIMYKLCPQALNFLTGRRPKPLS